MLFLVKRESAASKNENTDFTKNLSLTISNMASNKMLNVGLLYYCMETLSLLQTQYVS